MSRTIVRYTIPLDSSAQVTHRLGVNSLAIDPSNHGTLYSAGRDGIIVAWDLKMDLSRAPDKYNEDATEIQVDGVHGDATHKRSIQAHTHWVNQIAISSDYQRIYSCSSDTAVKCWRPNAFESDKAESLGSHADYVKCLVVPKDSDQWIGTAGLDRSIVLWDSTGKGERSRIDGGSKDGGMKQSIYSLVSGPNMLVSGGIEKIIRVWDTRSSGRITKLIGHTDNVRSLLCSNDGKTVVSASSDNTVKIWDLAAGRCLHTLTMHSEPVWALLSDHPNLAVFHAGDKSGLVTKTDLRPKNGGDHDECTAICKEETGINSLAQLGDKLFTATASSNLNRWQDQEMAPTDLFADPGSVLTRVESVASSHSTRKMSDTGRRSSLKQHRRPSYTSYGQHTNSFDGSGLTNGRLKRSSIWSQASVISLPLEGDSSHENNNESMEPIRQHPESCIRGQAGLAAHKVLSDRRRVLTTDTAGFVKLWDITLCKQVSDFGKVDIEEVETKLQSSAAIGSWCSVNTRVGALTVELDPRNLLDAETYFDTVQPAEGMSIETRNQRFNIGKWILRALFQELINYEIKSDSQERSHRKARRPGRLNLDNLAAGELSMQNGNETPKAQMSSPIPGSKNPYASAMSTPGASFGLATPAPTYNPKFNGSSHQSQSSMSSIGSVAASPTVATDYFSSPHGTKDPDATPVPEPATPGSVPKTPGGSSLMKNIKWLRSSKVNKPAPPDARRNSVISSSPVVPVVAADMPVDASQQIPKNYKEFVARQRTNFSKEETKQLANGSTMSTWIQPPDPMPDLQLPPAVDVSIAIFKPGEGEAKDIYRGKVGTLVNDLKDLTPLLPVWLAQILLLNEVPPQMQNTEANKHYFSFLPHPKSSLQDPFNGTPTNLMRLGAARSLRIRKALTYISQRLSTDVVERESQGRTEEDWLEIIVNGTTVDPDWTMMMTRRHLWKQGGDMKLEYRLKREASS